MPPRTTSAGSAHSISQHEVELGREQLAASQQPHQRGSHEHFLEVTFRQRLREVGDLVDLEALVGLVDPPLARFQQGVQVHRPCVVVDVIRALPVGEELDALDQASWVPHDGIEVVGCIVVDLRLS